MSTTDALAEREGALEALAEALDLRLVSSRFIRLEASSDGFITGHEVELENATGHRQRETVFIDSNSDHPRDAAALRLVSDTGDQLVGWLYPADPALPSLPAAVYPDAVTVLLVRLGLDTDGLDLSVLAYRPGKRAVVRVTTHSGVVFLKVLKPRVAEPLHARHTAWLDAGIPVPRAVAWSPEGIVALEPVTGVEAIGMIESLAASERFVDELASLMARIAALPSAAPARASLATRLDWYERRLRALEPALGARASVLVQRIAATFTQSGPPPAKVTIHGDLHLAQVFVDPADPERITGLLDIDTAGLGDPADDAAALWAHLQVTARQYCDRGETQRATAASALAARFGRHAESADDPGHTERVRAIAATHLLGHALAGALSADAAMNLAEALIADEKALTTTSLTPHARSQR